MDLAASYLGRKGVKALFRKEQSTESVRRWTGRARLRFCPVRVCFDDRMLCPWDVGNQWVRSAVTSLATEPMPLAALDHSLRLHGLPEGCSNTRRLSQQGQEGPRNILVEIQIPDLLILRTSHRRKEEETTKLSIFSFRSHPLWWTVRVVGCAAIFTLRFPGWLTYVTPQSTQLHL